MRREAAVAAKTEIQRRRLEAEDMKTVHEKSLETVRAEDLEIGAANAAMNNANENFTAAKSRCSSAVNKKRGIEAQLVQADERERAVDATENETNNRVADATRIKSVAEEHFRQGRRQDEFRRSCGRVHDSTLRHISVLCQGFL